VASDCFYRRTKVRQKSSFSSPVLTVDLRIVVSYTLVTGTPSSDGRLDLQQPGEKLYFAARDNQHSQGLANQAPRRGIGEGFLARSTGTMKLGLYARVSTHAQRQLGGPALVTAS